MYDRTAVQLIWIFLSVLFQAAAQTLGKQAAAVSHGSGLTAMVFNGWYVLELLMLGCQAACWVMALRYFPLSFAYPFMSLVIGFNLLSGWGIFGETVQIQHIIGIATIMAGVVLISRRTAA